MDDKKIKTYAEDGKQYRFDSDKMKELIEREIVKRAESERKTKGKRINLTAVMNDIADELGVGFETVKGWKNGKNGPVNMDTVKKIAGYFKTDYHVLLKEEKEMNNNIENKVMDNVSNTQSMITKDRVREVYESLIDAIDKAWKYFEAEDSYNFETRYTKEDWAEKTGSAGEAAEEACKKVDYLLTKYMLDIPKELSEKLHVLMMSKAYDVFMETVCLFCDHDEEEMEEVWEGIYNMREEGAKYRDNKLEVIAEPMREVFADYIVG